MARAGGAEGMGSLLSTVLPGWGWGGMAGEGQGKSLDRPRTEPQSR